MKQKNLKKTHKRIGKSFTNILIQAEPQNAPTSGYDTIAFVNNKFSSLVSSGTVYFLRYAPKKKHIAK
ncbi:MAG: hypothetical protein E3J73_06445 [Candidatus Bathyarchaeum sp.]|nr:MAG: hypothetical protein E3J73_06445 [Candidatus Bathyarchaeum sp.]